jgi:putative amide transporter protein
VLAGLALFYVGAVLCSNGLWVLVRIGDKEIAVIDIFVGGITLLVALNLAFRSGY